jgi:hypothetical protein
MCVMCSELYVRQDFVRLRKREEEEATSSALLTSMLPEVIVNEIRHDITLIVRRALLCISLLSGGCNLFFV